MSATNLCTCGALFTGTTALICPPCLERLRREVYADPRPEYADLVSVLRLELEEKRQEWAEEEIKALISAFKEF